MRILMVQFRWFEMMVQDESDGGSVEWWYSLDGSVHGVVLIHGLAW